MVAWRLARKDRETHINTPFITCQNFTTAAVKDKSVNWVVIPSPTEKAYALNSLAIVFGSW